VPPAKKNKKGRPRPAPRAAQPARPGLPAASARPVAVAEQLAPAPPAEPPPAEPPVPELAVPEPPAAGPPQGDADEELPEWAAHAVEQLLTPTYWLDPGPGGEPFSATVRFSGRRADVTGPRQPRDAFRHEVTVNGIVPGSGPVAISTEVRGINPGQWTLTARSVVRPGGRTYTTYPPPGHAPDGRYRVPAPRRVAVPAEPQAVLHSSSLLRSKVPGVIRYAYAPLVGLGGLVGLGLVALLLTHGHYPLLRPMLFSVLAIAAGAAGGKGWYIAVHKGRKLDGWCIQGFVAGAAAVVAAAALAGPGLPAGAFLAAAAPALLIGMSIGRLGCFWAGCCTGRPTAARWGIWSSDRRLGCRRAPAQLAESLAALLAGAAVLAVVLAGGLARTGPAAVVGLAAYTLGRQFILGLRAEARAWRHGRAVTGTLAALAFAAGLALLIHR
jgi:phosphatidylglycerol:prolipoprotein diacylglycerol transferase